MTEDDLHKTAVIRLEARKLREANPDNFEFWHTANGAHYHNPWQGKQFQRRGVLPGVSDLIVADNGKMYFVELKSEAGKLSTSQKRFLKKMGVQGHETEVVYGLEDWNDLCERRGW